MNENKMIVEYLPVKELNPYENNPRNNDNAVEFVANSIKAFGFRNPIIVDRKNVIIAGHTRLKAAKSIGLETVPCIRADDLTEDQIKAFRIADNKVAEFATWDIERLNIELEEIQIDMAEFGIDDIEEPDIDDLEEGDGEIEDNIKTPVAVKIIFSDGQKWREHEKIIRDMVDGLDDVSVSVGGYYED